MSGGSFGLIGGRLGHSISPLIHGCFGTENYHLWSIPRDGLSAFMAERPFTGINVTIPYKTDVMLCCDYLSDTAMDCCSVNTVLKQEDGSLLGCNTDYGGFLYLAEQNGFDFKNSRVVIAGSGGAARTVRTAVLSMGAAGAVLLSRSGNGIPYREKSAYCDADYFINCTPAGMYPQCGLGPLTLDVFHGLRGVIDLIYRPVRTQLLLEAERLGIPNAGGLDMLVEQARLAEELFMGTEIPRELNSAAKSAAERFLKGEGTAD